MFKKNYFTNKNKLRILKFYNNQLYNFFTIKFTIALNYYSATKILGFMKII